MTAYVVTCAWRGTSLKLRIEAASEEEALEKARRSRQGHGALTYTICHQCMQAHDR